MQQVSNKYRRIETADITAQVDAVLAARGLLPASLTDRRWSGDTISASSATVGYSVKTMSVRGKGSTHGLKYTLHGLRTTVNGDSVTPTINIVNSYGGERAFQITVGFFRLVCSNGMIVGTALFNRRIVHLKGETTERQLAEVALGIAAALDYLAGDFAKDMQQLATTTVSQDVMVRISQAVGLSKSRLADVESKIRNVQSRRLQDRGDNLWTLWNLLNETLRLRSRSELRQLLVNNDLLDQINQAYLKEAA